MSQKSKHRGLWRDRIAILTALELEDLEPSRAAAAHWERTKESALITASYKGQLT